VPRKRRKRLNGFGYSSGNRFVKLDFWMLKSSAWKQLCPVARALLIELMQRYNGQNNGAISFSHREAAAALRVGKNRPFTLFRELEKIGFIKARQRGSFTWKARHATTWTLTMFDCNGIAATKEFMRVGEEIQNPLPATGTDGLSFRDDVNQTPGPDAPQGPDQRDCQTRLSTFVDPSYRDTSNIPGRVASVGPDQTPSGENHHAIGATIKVARRERGWSQSNLAKRAGVSRSHLANIEAGRFGSSETLASVCRVLALPETNDRGLVFVPPSNEGAA
jgi:DNA-binding XRE family transcriptional regulator